MVRLSSDFALVSSGKRIHDFIVALPYNCLGYEIGVELIKHSDSQPCVPRYARGMLLKDESE